mmetsp:Transcript_25005/g.56427  ORF Transcript_25005/g.56427 Transcript_25005/m.56427 type:complete len:292 (+) Transcript_25005:937-1812(+)
MLAEKSEGPQRKQKKPTAAESKRSPSADSVSRPSEERRPVLLGQFASNHCAYHACDNPCDVSSNHSNAAHSVLYPLPQLLVAVGSFVVLVLGCKQREKRVVEHSSQTEEPVHEDSQDPGNDVHGGFRDAEVQDQADTAKQRRDDQTLLAMRTIVAHRAAGDVQEGLQGNAQGSDLHGKLEGSDRKHEVNSHGRSWREMLGIPLKLAHTRNASLTWIFHSWASPLQRACGGAGEAQRSLVCLITCYVVEKYRQEDSKRCRRDRLVGPIVHIPCNPLLPFIFYFLAVIQHKAP